MAKSISQLIQNSSKTIRLALSTSPKLFFLFLASILVLSLLPILNNYFNALVFQQIANSLTRQNFDLNLLIRYFALAVVTNIFIQLNWKINSLVERLLWLNLGDTMGSLVHRKISSLDFQKLEDPAFITILNKVKEGWQGKPQDFSNRIFWIFSDLIQILGTLVIISTISPLYFIIIFLSLLPSLVIRLKNEKSAWGIWDSKGDVKNKYYDTSRYLSNDDSLPEIRIFGSAEKLLKLFSDSYNSFKTEEINVSLKYLKYELPARLIEIILFASVEIDLIVKAVQQKISVSQYSFVSGSMYRFSSSLNNFFYNTQRIYSNNLFMTDLFTLLETKNIIYSQPNAQIISTSTVPKIEFKNVSFKYPKSNKYVFKDINITINPGEDIALVGENGAGKTTFVKLLSRFYDVTSGQILVNGTNIKDIDLSSWYQNLGILFQTFNHYSYSVAENIQLGNPSKIPTQKDLLSSSKLSGAFSFIKKFPFQFNQILSKSYENGTALSGGQWQRIALSRAFYRNANILVLDEPTSAIDAKGEYEIFQKLNQLQEKKTTIIISHRFSTVKNADKIYVLKDGKIIEQGNHKQLMSLKNGTYQSMYTLQANAYKS